MSVERDQCLKMFGHLSYSKSTFLDKYVFTIFVLVKWDIKEEHLVYGHDVMLTCNGTSCSPKAIKKWIGGPSFNLLCFDGYSTNETKYKMRFNHSRQEFYLIIKGFFFH